MPTTPTDLSTRTPVEIDTALAEIFMRVYRARHRALSLRERANSAAKYQSRDTESAEQQAAEAQLAVEEILEETTPFEEEFSRRGGWTRAFLVTSSSNGHVHSSRGCSTCRLSTEFIWLPEYSGAAEDTIVGDAGERACTTCYPTAPVDVLQRATKIFSPKEKEDAQARIEREAQRAVRAAERDAKAIAAADGGPLRVPSYGVVKTERTAQTLYVDRAAENAAHAEGLLPDFWTVAYPDEAQTLLAALAGKRGITVDEAREALAPKVAARVRRDYRS